MPTQPFLIGFPDGAMKIGDSLSILKKEKRVTYFVGCDNYFSHTEGDLRSQRFAFATLLVNGHVRPRDLEEPPLSIPHRTLMNWQEQLRDKGPESFFRRRRTSNVSVMVAAKTSECEEHLRAGLSVAEVARRVGVEESTLRKAIGRGAVKRLSPLSRSSVCVKDGSSKAERSQADAIAASGMGTACTRPEDRVLAAVGLAESATARFEHSRDVAMGGLLVGLPALCANGLLSGLGKHLQLRGGFYSCLHILLTMAFMALGRIRRPEGLRHLPPGELGKLIGLDRIPEVRTLRAKITEMASLGKPEAWMRELSRIWMGESPDEAGYLYVDGHIRVYHGKKATLPRRYVSRQRLCLRGTTDYWVNDAIGRPFFVVSKAVTDGLADALLKNIVPELMASVPGQPTAAELEKDPLLHRFVIVFDREGSNHSLISSLWEKRIGAITYRKNVKDSWPEDEFHEHEVPLPGGGNTRMRLAMRETALAAGTSSMPVTEVRRLVLGGHQTAVITSARNLGNTVIAGRMFARWCQENFFAYMMEHFDIDGLIQYGAEMLPGTLQVVNPAWRNLDKAVKKALRSVRKLQAKLGTEMRMEEESNIQKSAECLENVQGAQATLKQLREQRRKTPKKTTLDSLPLDQRPTQLLPLNKQLGDTVKMIAYRAETALVALLRRYLKKEDEARALIRELFVSSADIEPENDAGTMAVRIHRMASPAHDKAVSALLKDISMQNFCHPETGAVMTFSLV
jgi:transposase-like protein